MKVVDLIKKLSEYPPDLEVAVYDNTNTEFIITDCADAFNYNKDTREWGPYLPGGQEQYMGPYLLLTGES